MQEHVDYYTPELVRNYDRPVLYSNTREVVDRTLRRCVGRECPAFPTVLDIGSGTGNQYRAYLRIFGTRTSLYYTGVEPSKAMRAEFLRRKACCRGWNPDEVKVLCGTFEEARFPPSTRFDIVNCCSTLIHLKNPIQALTDMCALVSPGGYLVLDTDNRTGPFYRLWARLNPRAHAQFEEDAHQSQTFTVSELRDTIEWSGLTLTAVVGVNVFTSLIPMWRSGEESGRVPQGFRALAALDSLFERFWPFNRWGLGFILIARRGV